MENINAKDNKIVAKLSYFLLGTALGAAAGVFLAPDSGKENRRKLAQWLKDKRAKSRDRLHTVETAIEAGRKAYSESVKKPAGM